MNIKIVGIDLAKNVFQICALNRANKVIFNRSVTRARLMHEIRQLPQTVIAMEACSTAHYWGRKCAELGHEVRLLPAQHVRAFVRNGKSDAKDALAICEAAERPDIHLVPIKSTEQLDLQVLHRARQRYVQMRTALANQIRGIAREYGVYFLQGVRALDRAVPAALEDADNELSASTRSVLQMLLEELHELTAKKATLDRQLQALARSHPHYERLLELPGFGPVVASAFIAAIGTGRQFRRGRQVAAWAGLVPRQHSSGGKLQLYGITKNGDRYLRTQLIHGARAVTTWVLNRPQKTDPMARWVRQLVARRGKNKAVVALANKMARIGWAVIGHDEPYRPEKAFAAR